MSQFYGTNSPIIAIVTGLAMIFIIPKEKLTAIMLTMLIRKKIYYINIIRYMIPKPTEYIGLHMVALNKGSTIIVDTSCVYQNIDESSAILYSTLFDSFEIL